MRKLTGPGATLQTMGHRGVDATSFFKHAVLRPRMEAALGAALVPLSMHLSVALVLLSFVCWSLRIAAGLPDNDQLFAPPLSNLLRGGMSFGGLCALAGFGFIIAFYLVFRLLLQRTLTSIPPIHECRWYQLKSALLHTGYSTPHICSLILLLCIFSGFLVGLLLKPIIARAADNGREDDITAFQYKAVVVVLSVTLLAFWMPLWFFYNGMNYAYSRDLEAERPLRIFSSGGVRVSNFHTALLLLQGVVGRLCRTYFFDVWPSSRSLVVCFGIIITSRIAVGASAIDMSTHVVGVHLVQLSLVILIISTCLRTMMRCAVSVTLDAVRGAYSFRGIDWMSALADTGSMVTYASNSPREGLLLMQLAYDDFADRLEHDEAFSISLLTQLSSHRNGLVSLAYDSMERIVDLVRHVEELNHCYSELETRQIEEHDMTIAEQPFYRRAYWHLMPAGSEMADAFSQARLVHSCTRVIMQLLRLVGHRRGVQYPVRSASAAGFYGYSAPILPAATTQGFIADATALLVDFVRELKINQRRWPLYAPVAFHQHISSMVDSTVRHVLVARLELIALADVVASELNDSPEFPRYA